MLPFGEAYDTELANVLIETALSTKGEVVRAAILACGIAENVPAIYSAPEEAKLVVDSKQKRIWIEGVEITVIQPDTHGYFFVEALARHLGPLSLEELSKRLSEGRQDGDLTARQAKTHVRKMIAEAMAAVGRSFDEDPFPTGGRGCYRCALPPYVQ